MILLSDVKSLIQMLNTENNIGIQHFYCGTLDSKKDKSLGVYQLKRGNEFDIAIGGETSTLHRVKPISLLVHWNHNSIETEQAAAAMYNAIITLDTVQRAITIGGYAVDCIIPLQNEPVDVGQDDSGIFERVIELLIYHKTNKEENQ